LSTVASTATMDGNDFLDGPIVHLGRVLQAIAPDSVVLVVGGQWSHK